jgi:quercetin dioxygenase-like cupin family protein
MSTMIEGTGLSSVGVRVRPLGRAGDDVAFAVFEVHAPAGVVLPPHVRSGADAILVVLEGTLAVVCGERRRRVGAGESVTLPRDVPCRIDAAADVHLLCVARPAAFEDLLGLLDDARVGPDDLAALAAAAGVTLLPAHWERPRPATA